MAPEVISLLSSPEPEPLPSKAPARTSKTLQPVAQKFIGQVSDWSFDAIDRIPESSNPGPSAQAPKKDDWWDSDDFDITGDLGGGGGDKEDDDPFADDRPAKKRRLSKDPFSSPVSVTSLSKSTKPIASKSYTTSRPIASYSPPRASKKTAPADFIDLSSSPVIPEQIAPHTTKPKVDSFLALDSDLSDSDPFNSSPRHNTKLPVAGKASNYKENDLPPGRLPRVSPKKSAAWDPISSSAPAANGSRSSPPPRAMQRSRSDVITLDDDSDLGDLAFASDSSEDDEEFPDDLSKIKALQLKRRPDHSLKRTTSAPTRTISSKPRASAVPKRTTEERDREREQKRLERELAKEEAKGEKEKLKEQRAHEKKQAAALAEVNKIRTDKKASTPEMLVDLPLSLPDTVKLQTQTLLGDLDVEFQPWSSPVENVVKWRRKVRARYNQALGHWEPVPMRIEPEKHALVIMPAQQFVDLVLANQPGAEGDSSSLDSHIASMKRHFPGHTLIYLIEGLTPWLRRNRNTRDRHFQAAVRSGLPVEPDPATTSSSAATSRRRKTPATTKPTPQYINEDLLDSALLSLQIHHRVLIHHTTLPLETARQITIFTQHLSTLPYRRVKDLETASSGSNFCMDSGQVKTGDGPKDTFVRMLQEISRITAPIAYAIQGEFGTVGRMVRELEKEGGQTRLEDVRRWDDKEGRRGDRRVGPAVSKRVWKVFSGREEGSMDV
ncbi:ERCC4 domain-containing protein [Coniochaeta sp. 2T2.1]|nr:ERCC4 domain-containing protein [Coniochaeta sp. 2T2.1]